MISYLSKENELRTPSPAKSNGASKLVHLAKLWICFGKSLASHGVLIDGQVIAEEPARTLALGKAWQPTFEAKDFDETAAISFLQSIGNSGEYSCDMQGPDFSPFQGNFGATSNHTWQGHHFFCRMACSWRLGHFLYAVG